MSKSFMEMATEGVNALVAKGYVMIPGLTKEGKWKERNKEAIKTYGWAVEQLLRELYAVPEKAKKPEKENKKQQQLITRLSGA